MSKPATVSMHPMSGLIAEPPDPEWDDDPVSRFEREWWRRRLAASLEREYLAGFGATRSENVSIPSTRSRPVDRVTK